MKLVRVSYTILHSFEVPDDWDDTDVGWACEDFAIDEGFRLICSDWEAEIEQDGKIVDHSCMVEMETKDR